MRLHEYQAKEILGKTGIPVPDGGIASTPEEVLSIFEQLGAGLVVIKAQALTGGRGKAGGVKTARDAQEAANAAASIIGRRLFTAQTGPEGALARLVLVEEGLAVEKEYYVAVTIDRKTARPVIIVSASGGMDIEEVARITPEKIIREYVEPVFGLQPYQTRKLAYAVGVPQEDIKSFVDILLKLHLAFLVSDAELVEVNPLVKVEADSFVALDAKVIIDDNAMFRHEDIRKLQEPADIDPLEYEAGIAGVNYIRMKGNIGCMVNGAGLAMSTMDLIKTVGGEPANFLDVGGGADTDQIHTALGILLKDKQVSAVLINIFGGILRCDVLAQGIVEAARELEISVPIVARLEGTNRDEGERILRESGLGITFARTMREAAELAVGKIKSNA